MQRRDFLRTALAGALTLAAPLTVAAAIPAPDPNQHIIDALHLYDDLIIKAAVVKELKLGYKSESVEKDAMHEACDRLFEHIFKTFRYERTEEVFNAIYPMIQGVNPVSDEIIRKVPPVIIESAWPVAMMKVILRDQAMPINHRKLKTFKVFHQKYGDFILSESWESIARSDAQRGVLDI